jgi:phosphoinositide-3-kinase regulatory subunit 4
MDVFSAGCVIAELYLEGEALFDLSALLAYRFVHLDATSSFDESCALQVLCVDWYSLYCGD